MAMSENIYCNYLISLIYVFVMIYYYSWNVNMKTILHKASELANRKWNISERYLQFLFHYHYIWIPKVPIMSVVHKFMIFWIVVFLYFTIITPWIWFLLHCWAVSQETMDLSLQWLQAQEASNNQLSWRFKSCSTHLHSSFKTIESQILCKLKVFQISMDTSCPAVTECSEGQQTDNLQQPQWW